MRSEIDVLLESLAERIAERVCERLIEHQAVAENGNSPWMGIEKAAAYLDWPKGRLYKLTASGEIPHYKQEGRLLFRADQIDRWLSQFAQGERLDMSERHPKGRAIVACDGNENELL